MITASDSYMTVDLGEFYAILPSAGDHSLDNYVARQGGAAVPPGFAYNSGTNPDVLSVEQLRALIRPLQASA